MSDKNTLPSVLPDAFVIDGITIGPGYVFSHGIQLKGNPRKRACKYLVRRDGTRCQIPGHIEDIPDAFRCDVDHIDGVYTNHIAANLRRTCHNGNASYGWIQKNPRLANRPSILGLKDKETQGSPTETSPNNLPEPVEKRIMEKSLRNEPEFRRFYFKRLIEVEQKMMHREMRQPEETIDRLATSITPEKMRVDAREEVGCSKPSSYSYQERLIVASNGPCRVVADNIDGMKANVVMFRDKACYNMEPDQVAALYPVEGQLYKRTGR